ncbi:MAG TPA: hypothetical protein VG937_28890 [Polyangiaceae bacterium]|nr:hypothetical protein [Polyangiaceae bacterium]
MKQTTKARVLAPLLLSLVVPLCALQAAGCKKDEPPPPLPSAAPVATTPPPPTQPLELVPEVAPAPSASASAEPVKTGGGGGGSSLKKCCAALTQNAQSAPEPNKTYMLQAAAICNAAVGASGAIPSGAITAALRGAGMPTACK